MTAEKPDSVLDSELEPEERDDTVITQALLWSLAVLLVAGVGIGAIVYFTRPGEEPPAPEQEAVAPARKRERPPVSVPKLRFTDVTRAAGITFVHENGASAAKLLPETMGGGVAFFDFDNDGDPDLLFVGSKRWDWDKSASTQRPSLALYANDGEGTFKDVTSGSGLDVSLFGMGVAVGDYDGDGRTDVYVTALGRNRLFRNLGKGKFEDVTDAAGVAGADDAWSTSAGFFDCDNDGDLDLFVCNYVQWSREYDEGQRFSLVGGQRAYGQPQRFPGSFSYLFRNDGRGKFTDVSAASGIQVVNRKKTAVGKSLGVCFADFDRDGYLDIVVANDTVQNFLFRNNGNGTFREMGVPANIAYDMTAAARGAMGIDVARFRNTEELGVAIGNFSNEMTALYVSRNGQLLFTDDAVSNGIGPVTRQQLTFGLFFFDADLDGRPDIFASNGHLERDIAKVQARQTYAQPPQLLWNCGPGYATEFLPVVAPEKPLRKRDEADAAFQKRVEAYRTELKDFQLRMGDFVRPMVGRGAAFADVDLDGDLDVVIVGSGQPARLLRNDQNLGHNWLQVKLVGPGANREAIGALVEVYLGDGKDASPPKNGARDARPAVLRQQVMPTRSYLSQVELPLTFGLGKIDHVRKIRIIWPGGVPQEVTDGIRINSRIEVRYRDKMTR